MQNTNKNKTKQIFSSAEFKKIESKSYLHSLPFKDCRCERWRCLFLRLKFSLLLPLLAWCQCEESSINSKSICFLPSTGGLWSSSKKMLKEFTKSFRKLLLQTRSSTYLHSHSKIVFRRERERDSKSFLLTATTGTTTRESKSLRAQKPFGDSNSRYNSTCL